MEYHNKKISYHKNKPRSSSNDFAQYEPSGPSIKEMNTDDKNYNLNFEQKGRDTVKYVYNNNDFDVDDYSNEETIQAVNHYEEEDNNFSVNSYEDIPFKDYLSSSKNFLVMLNQNLMALNNTKFEVKNISGNNDEYSSIPKTQILEELKKRNMELNRELSVLKNNNSNCRCLSNDLDSENNYENSQENKTIIEFLEESYREIENENNILLKEVNYLENVNNLSTKREKDNKDIKAFLSIEISKFKKILDNINNDIMPCDTNLTSQGHKEPINTNPQRSRMDRKEKENNQNHQLYTNSLNMDEKNVIDFHDSCNVSNSSNENTSNNQDKSSTLPRPCGKTFYKPNDNRNMMMSNNLNKKENKLGITQSFFKNTNKKYNYLNFNNKPSNNTNYVFMKNSHNNASLSKNNSKNPVIISSDKANFKFQKIGANFSLRADKKA